jgi:murein L,D-transpeptidase YcbB/YkuD
MNLERWRWMPHDLGDPHILVNVPAYQMQVVENGEPTLAMRVIVGALDTPTPVFSDRMQYVVFSPYWNIPDSIVNEETIPRAAEDPEYLVRAGIEVVRASGRTVEPVDPADIDWSVDLASQGVRLRQVPGPDNALGLVKFIFPNNFSVYLHDTPSDALFHKPARALSHGCVRVEQPVTLAEYVLRERRGWSRARIEAAMHAQQESIVKLERPLPVHIGYWTAWVNPDGSVTYTGDPYAVDRRQADASKAAQRAALRRASNAVQTAASRLPASRARTR